jgi:hypothetical protein
MAGMPPDRELVERIKGAIFGALIGLAITAAFVVYETKFPDPHDRQKGGASPLVGFIFVPAGVLWGIFWANKKIRRDRSDRK